MTNREIMKTKRNSILHLIVVLFLLSANTINSQDTYDHKEIGRYGKSSITHQELGNLNEYVLALGPVRNDSVTKTIRIQGKLMMTYYRGPDDASSFEIYTAYRELLISKQYEILFSCSKNECGNKFLGAFYTLAPFASDYGFDNSTPFTRGNPDFSYFLTAKKENEGTTNYVSLLVTQGWTKYPVYKLDVIETQKQLGNFSSNAPVNKKIAADKALADNSTPQDVDQKALKFGFQMASDSYFGLLLRAKHFEVGPKFQFTGYDGFPGNVKPDDLLMVGVHACYLFKPWEKIDIGLGLDLRHGIPLIENNPYIQYLDAGLLIKFDYFLNHRFIVSGLFYPFWVNVRETDVEDSFSLTAKIPTAGVAVSFLF